MSIESIAVALAFGALGILFFIALTGILNILRGRRKFAPTLPQVIDALLPYMYRGIWAAERLALEGMQQADAKLTGWDKKTIADQVYDLLPPVLHVGELIVPLSLVKMIISRERFERLLEDEYLAAHAFILANEAYLKNEVAAFTGKTE